MYKNGVRVIIQDLQHAPYQLHQNWDLLELVKGKGYRFRVELLRRWIADYKPLNSLRDELAQVQEKIQIRENDDINADIHYKDGLIFYNDGNLEKARYELQLAIMANPIHGKANQKLSEILIKEEQYEEARKVLEHFYKYQPVAARERLISVLLN